MKITLLNVSSKREECSNKDVMGGFGEVTKIGDSWRAKFLEKQKKVNIPLFSFSYLSGIFKKNGHEINFSLNKYPKDSDLIIIASSIVDYKSEIKAAQEIKNTTNAKIGFIGPFASFKPEIYSKYADFIIQGEPENAANKISNNSIPKGIVKSEPVKYLDNLPFPFWEIFPIKDYSYSPVITKKPFLPILSSRGCSYSCNYCPYKAYYGNCRQRRPESIIEELKHIVNEYGIKGILFRDPLFTTKRKRAEQLANSIIKNKIDIEWTCETHFDLLDEKLIGLLYKAGLRSINVGIESSNEEIMEKSTRKYAKKEHQEKIIKYCDKTGIKVSAFYILGLKGETERSINQTIEYAKNLNTFSAQFFISTPFPGTEFYEEVKDKIFETDWTKFNSFTPVFKHENLTSEQLLKLKEKAFVEYYFRPKYALKYMRHKIGI